MGHVSVVLGIIVIALACTSAACSDPSETSAGPDVTAPAGTSEDAVMALRADVASLKQDLSAMGRRVSAAEAEARKSTRQLRVRVGHVEDGLNALRDSVADAPA